MSLSLLVQVLVALVCYVGCKWAGLKELGAGGGGGEMGGCRRRCWRGVAGVFGGNGIIQRGAVSRVFLRVWDVDQSDSWPSQLFWMQFEDGRLRPEFLFTPRARLQ